MLAGESYTCIKWICSAPLTSCGLTPRFVHINDIPECVWMALVHTRGLSFQRHANASFAALSGSLLTARATVNEMIGTLQPPSPPEYSHVSNNTCRSKKKIKKKTLKCRDGFTTRILSGFSILLRGSVTPFHCSPDQCFPKRQVSLFSPFCLGFLCYNAKKFGIWV